MSGAAFKEGDVLENVAEDTGHPTPPGTFRRIRLMYDVGGGKWRVQWIDTGRRTHISEKGLRERFRPVQSEPEK